MTSLPSDPQPQRFDIPIKKHDLQFAAMCIGVLMYEDLIDLDFAGMGKEHNFENATRILAKLLALYRSSEGDHCPIINW